LKAVHEEPVAGQGGGCPVFIVQDHPCPDLLHEGRSECEFSLGEEGRIQKGNHLEVVVEIKARRIRNVAHPDHKFCDLRAILRKKRPKQESEIRDKLRSELLYTPEIMEDHGVILELEIAGMGIAIQDAVPKQAFKCESEQDDSRLVFAIL